MANGLLRKSAQMGRRQLLQRNLRAGSQLGDDLTCTERSHFPAALQAFSLGVGMQEAAGVKVSSSCGVRRVRDGRLGGAPGALMTSLTCRQLPASWPWPRSTLT